MGPRATRLGPGRPTKNPGENKSMTIQFRVTPEQHQQLCESAEAAGKTMSAWLLGLGLKAAGAPKKRR